MLKVVMGFALFIRVERKRPVEAKRIFNKKVYIDRIKNAFILKTPFFTSSIHKNPASAVTKFSKNTLR